MTIEREKEYTDTQLIDACENLLNELPACGDDSVTRLMALLAKELKKRLLAADAKLENMLNKPIGVCHKSDCAVYNEPAYPAGVCDCGFKTPRTEQEVFFAVNHADAYGPEERVVPAEFAERIEIELSDALAKLNEPVGEIKLYAADRKGDVFFLEDGDEYYLGPNDSGKLFVRYEDHLQAMRARVPEGYVLVPNTPTQNMIQAMENRQVEGADTLAPHSAQSFLWVEVWKAGIAASPKPE